MSKTKKPAVTFREPSPDELITIRLAWKKMKRGNNSYWRDVFAGKIPYIRIGK